MPTAIRSKTETDIEWYEVFNTTKVLCQVEVRTQTEASLSDLVAQLFDYSAMLPCQIWTSVSSLSKSLRGKDVMRRQTQCNDEMLT